MSFSSWNGGPHGKPLPSADMHGSRFCADCGDSGHMYICISLSLYIYMLIHNYMGIYIYIYIYIYLFVYIYICVYSLESKCIRIEGKFFFRGLGIQLPSQSVNL